MVAAHDAQVGQRPGVVGLELQYSFELGARFGQPSFARELRREVVSCIDEIRIAVERRRYSALASADRFSPDKTTPRL